MAFFYDSPRGAAYSWLIDYAMERSAVFVLARRGEFQIMEEAERVFSLLEPYLIEKRKISERDIMKRLDEETVRGNGIEYGAGTYYIYKCCEEAAVVLKQAADDLFAWQHPHLPEDLNFWDHDGQDLLHHVAHERMGGLQIGQEEAENISAMVPGLFLSRPEHKKFEVFWQDVLFHKPRKLEIFGFGIREIPESIGELKELKELMIHESYVTRLPAALFGLTELEDLTVYTEDLVEIPAEIGELIQLKRLNIACGSYHGPTDHVIRREEVSLTRVPPEIGRLRLLEQLSMNYTGILELPMEMGQLQNLSFLDLSRNQLQSEPEFIEKLTGLSYVNLSDNRYNPSPQNQHWDDYIE
ncbi:leucine-rich repeat domain-containing protein [Paenibacillus sp. CR_12]|uniref:leucine-rich repeat domain-containing protein n=1 Tax=Paenibacillus sp. CR_12 TaxID=3055793 RepID=UPI0035BFB5A2